MTGYLFTLTLALSLQGREEWYLDSGIRRDDGLFTLTLAFSLEGRGEWYLGSGIRRNDGLFTLTLALSLEGRGGGIWIPAFAGMTVIYSPSP